MRYLALLLLAGCATEPVTFDLSDPVDTIVAQIQFVDLTGQGLAGDAIVPLPGMGVIRSYPLTVENADYASCILGHEVFHLVYGPHYHPVGYAPCGVYWQESTNN